MKKFAKITSALMAVLMLSTALVLPAGAATKKKVTAKLSATTYVYSGQAVKPKVTVKTSSGKALKVNKNYTVSYAKGRTNVGKYAVKIKYKGNYTGAKTLYFKINPKATSLTKLTAGGGALKVSWKKLSKQVTGYQIKYSTSKSFSSAESVNVSYKTSSVKLTGLKGSKTYYVKIRAYKTVGGKKYYSKWSSVLSKKTLCAHSYKNYKCTKCKQLQSGKVVDYLKSQIYAKGSVNDWGASFFEMSDDGSVTFYLSHNKTSDETYVSYTMYFEDGYEVSINLIFANSGKHTYRYYYCNYVDLNDTYQIEGKIDAATLTESTKLTATSYIGDSSVYSTHLSVAREALDLLLSCTGYYLDDYGLGVTLKDLGFTNY